MEPGVLLWGDELLLMRLVTLLTDNARRYARTCVTLRLERQGNTVTLRVCDDGPGIAPELRERGCLTGSSRRRATGGGEHGGAGLGLTLARGHRAAAWGAMCGWRIAQPLEQRCCWSFPRRIDIRIESSHALRKSEK